MSLKRVIVYIDGFNCYHAIDDLNVPHLKWVNYWESSKQLLQRDEVLVAVKYFSAYADHFPHSLARHKVFVKALKSTGVQCFLGKFKEKTQYCKNCGAILSLHEEKETDVQIAIHLLADATSRSCDVAILVSGDSDLVPVVKMCRRLMLPIEIVTASTPSRSHCKEIRDLKCRTVKLSRTIVEHSLFPASIVLSDGTTVNRPYEYDPPV